MELIQQINKREFPKITNKRTFLLKSLNIRDLQCRTGLEISNADAAGSGSPEADHGR